MEASVSSAWSAHNIASRLVQHLDHRVAGVDADQVGERQRAHRVSHAQLHDFVDALGAGEAFVIGVGGLVEHRDQDPVGDEAGAVLRLHGDLADKFT
jgi:hypothetical protein